MNDFILVFGQWILPRTTFLVDCSNNLFNDNALGSKLPGLKICKASRQCLRKKCIVFHSSFQVTGAPSGIGKATAKLFQVKD